jgi:hypothetical protein
MDSRVADADQRKGPGGPEAVAQDLAVKLPVCPQSKQAACHSGIFVLSGSGPAIKARIDPFLP